MNRDVMRPTLLAVAVLSLSGLAAAGPKKAPHPMTETGAGAGPTGKASLCGVKVFPLAVGNTWTYSMVPVAAAAR